MDSIKSVCSKLLEDFRNYKYADLSVCSSEMDISGLTITNLAIEKERITATTEYATYYIWLNKIQHCWREDYPEETISYTFTCEGEYEIGIDIY